MVYITDSQIETMANLIMQTENVGTGFIGKKEAIKSVKEAYKELGLENGVDWTAKVMKRAVEIHADNLQEKTETGYYFISGRIMYDEIPCTVSIHKNPSDENILSEKEFKKIFSKIPKGDSYGKTISFDVFTADEIPAVLKALNVDEPLTIKPLFKDEYKSDNYASTTVMGGDLRPKYGGTLVRDFEGVEWLTVVFSFDEIEENPLHSGEIAF